MQEILGGPSLHSLPPDRTILSFSHHINPSEFSPRPRKSVPVPNFNSSCCSVASGPLGKDFLLEIWAPTLQHPNAGPAAVAELG